MESTEKVVPISNRIVQVGVFQVDLAKVLPLTMGDQEALIKEPFNVNFKDPGKSPVEDTNLVWFILRKVEPQVTRDSVAALPVKISTAIVNYFTKISMEVEVPLGLLLTPSRGTTAGVSKT